MAKWPLLNFQGIWFGFWICLPNPAMALRKLFPILLGLWHGGIDWRDSWTPGSCRSRHIPFYWSWTNARFKKSLFCPGKELRRDESRDTNRFLNISLSNVHENINSRWSNTCIAAYICIYIYIIFFWCLHRPKPFKRQGLLETRGFHENPEVAKQGQKKDGFGTRHCII